MSNLNNEPKRFNEFDVYFEKGKPFNLAKPEFKAKIASKRGHVSISEEHAAIQNAKVKNTGLWYELAEVKSEAKEPVKKVEVEIKKK